MKTGDIIFCEFLNKTHGREYCIDHVKSVYMGVARTATRLKIDANTNIENNPKYGLRYWEVLNQENFGVYKNIKKMKEAQDWISKVCEFRSKIVEVYNACHNDPVDDRRFFHEISEEEYKTLLIEKTGYIKNTFRQPLWCGHPYALDGFFGCNRLLKHRRIDEEVCSRCSCFVIPKFQILCKKLRLVAGLTIKETARVLSIPDYADVEDEKRAPTLSEVERMRRFFSAKDWEFADVLELLYTKNEKRDGRLDELYRETIRKNK